MERPVCYDVTRLLTRILNATPNGIDRVDFALATHFLSGAPHQTFGSTATGFGARLLDGPAAAEAVGGIGAHWGENMSEASRDPVYRRVVAFLAGDKTVPTSPARRRIRLPRANVPGIAWWIGRHGLPVTRRPLAHLPPRSVYINASQFPLWVASSFEWLKHRPDISAAFFIHDLLPILLPEYFRAAEFERHQKRLRNFARFGAAAIVTTRTVAADLEAHLATLGRTDCPVFIAPTPLAPIFATPRVVDRVLGQHPFFIFCSTLEPRKNHQMILTVWRELAARLKKETPKLVLIGTRGWHYGPIIDLVERSAGLRDHVIEVGGLSTPALKRLIDNAQALLMPSFGEGYGLPVHEALAAGAPVAASDIPAFREIDAVGLTLLSPLDGEAWLAWVLERSQAARETRTEPSRHVADWPAYFERLDRFLDEL